MKIKICGLSRECDIDFVNEAGPDYIGFILHFPKSRRNIGAKEASGLRKRLCPGIKAVGVFVDQPLETVLETAALVGLDVIQLHGQEGDAYIRALRERAGLPVWKAFKVRKDDEPAAALQSAADQILLDNGCGTGEAFDWSALEGFARPFILAGGLTPERIPAAASIPGVRLLDLSSGVETAGVKDRERILAAVRAAHSAGQ